MKLSKDFIMHNYGGGTVMIPTSEAEFSGVVKGNTTLGAILKQLQNDTTEAQIVSALLDQFDGSEEQMRLDVTRTILELRKIGAIDG